MYKINNNKVSLLNPSEFGLSPRTLIGKYYDKHLVIIKDRKSRVIMKDGRIIAGQVEIVKKNALKAKVSFATNAAICSKTTKYLIEKGIEIFPLEK